MGVAQAGRQIQRADNLGHAHGRSTGGAGIAVGHIGRGLLRVNVQALDLGTQLQLDHSAPQYRGHHEHMADAIALQHIGHDLGTCHLRHFILPRLELTNFDGML